MATKKLCSLGILDININLVLHNNEAKNLNLNIDSYNNLEDLKYLFQMKGQRNEIINNINNKKNSINNSLDFNYMDYITLTSDNYLINTLLYINRASKIKTFIEFIMPNQLEYDDNKKFIKIFIEDVLSNNYFFIVENTIMNSSSKIMLIIKILDDDNDEIISTKNFELFERNEMDMERIEENNNYNDEKSILNIFLNKINYNFNKTDYFIIDLREIKKILLDYENIFNFLFKIVNKYFNLTIIIIIDENINEQNKNELFIIKKILELSDIIFCFKNNMNNFLKSFYSLKKRDISEKSPSKIFFLPKNKDNLSDLDLITKDFDKYRQNIPRLSIIFEEFNLVYLYKQHFLNKSLSYEKIFPLFLIKELDLNEDVKKFIYTNSNKLYHIFIGGFLSRHIYNKPFEMCLKAGNLLMKKTINIFMSKREFNINQDKYNIEVKYKNNNLIQKIKKIMLKEKHFILDCTNKAKSQKKEYNILSDNNCLGFLTKKYNSGNKKKMKLKKKIDLLLNKNRNKSNLYLYNMLISKKNLNNINNNNSFKVKKGNSPYSKKKLKGLMPFININDFEKNSKSNKEINFFYNHNDKDIKLKTIPFFFKSKDKNNHIINSPNIKRNENKNKIIKNILSNINKTENYNKYLFKIYLPNKSFEDFINEYNNLRNSKILK